MSYAVLAVKLKTLSEALTKNESKLESASLAKAATSLLSAAEKFEVKLAIFLQKPAVPAKKTIRVKKIAKPKTAGKSLKLTDPEKLKMELLRLGGLTEEEFQQEIKSSYGKKKDLETLATANEIKLPEKPNRKELIRRLWYIAHRSGQNVRV